MTVWDETMDSRVFVMELPANNHWERIRLARIEAKLAEHRRKLAYLAEVAKTRRRQTFARYVGIIREQGVSFPLKMRTFIPVGAPPWYQAGNDGRMFWGDA